MEANQAVYNRDTSEYTQLALMPSERYALAMYGRRWPEIEMLDVGIGLGRTSYTFAPIAKRYVGLDYAPQMVEGAKQLLGDTPDNVQLLEADARDLAGIEGKFDFVLFSYNGLDSVGHDDRLAILAELRKAIKPDGFFLFSSHSMNVLPLAHRRPRPPGRSMARSVYAWLRETPRARRLAHVNRQHDLAAARARGWTIIRDGAHNFGTEIYYVDPHHQVKQLKEVGFDVLEIHNRAGRPVDAGDAGTDPWLHYCCRPA